MTTATVLYDSSCPFIEVDGRKFFHRDLIPGSEVRVEYYQGIDLCYYANIEAPGDTWSGYVRIEDVKAAYG